MNIIMSIMGYEVYVTFLYILTKLGYQTSDSPATNGVCLAPSGEYLQLIVSCRCENNPPPKLKVYFDCVSRIKHNKHSTVLGSNFELIPRLWKPLLKRQQPKWEPAPTLCRRLLDHLWVPALHPAYQTLFLYLHYF